MPLRRPIPRVPTLFPFISDREDWPLKREEVGGWTLTPFGGRGRFRDEMVEIEGLVRLITVCRTFMPDITLHSSVYRPRRYTALARRFDTASSFGQSLFLHLKRSAIRRRVKSTSSSYRVPRLEWMFFSLGIAHGRTGP